MRSCARGKSQCDLRGLRGTAVLAIDGVVAGPNCELRAVNDV